MPGITLLEHLAVAGFAFDAGDRIVGWNPAAADLYGLSPTEAVGQSVLLLVPHEATADFQRAVAVVQDTGRWVGELRTAGVDQTPRVVEAAWSVVSVRGRRLVVALHTDVTDRQKRERDDRRTVALRAVRAVGRELADALPAAAGRLRLVTEWDELSLLNGGGRGVLVAGVDRLARELVRQLLVGHDYTVFVADTLFEAADLLRRFRDGIAAAVTGDRKDADELRRVRPLLPTVTLAPAAAGRELLADLAEAIAADVLQSDGVR